MDGLGPLVEGAPSPVTEQLIFALTLAAALGCGLNAGVFFAFSAFVMKALARLPPPQGIAAMQSINILAVTPLFMTALFGTALLCLPLVVISVMTWGDYRAPWLLAGGALHLGGNILVTMVCNVPLNNALAAADPSTEAGAALWRRYLAEWTGWNHLRTITGLLALASFIQALV